MGFGIRNRLKKGIKKVLGVEVSDTSPPNWQSRPPDYLSRHKASAPEVAPETKPPAAEAAPNAVSQTKPPAAEAAPNAVSQTKPPAAEAAAPESAAEAADDTAGAPLSMAAVQEVLDEMVRPALQGDGGDITLLKVENNDVYVKLVGACNTCPSAIMTMKMGVEALLREEFPQMNELIQVD